MEFNEETGLWEEEDPITGERKAIPLEDSTEEWKDTTMAERSAMRVLPYRVEERMAAEREQQEFMRALSAGEGTSNRPMFAQSPGQFLGDLGKVALNMPLGLATDLVDLATTATKLSPIGQAVDLGVGLAQGRLPQGGVQGTLDRLGQRGRRVEQPPHPLAA